MRWWRIRYFFGCWESCCDVFNLVYEEKETFSHFPPFPKWREEIEMICVLNDRNKQLHNQHIIILAKMSLTIVVWNGDGKEMMFGPYLSRKETGEPQRDLFKHGRCVQTHGNNCSWLEWTEECQEDRRQLAETFSSRFVEVSKGGIKIHSGLWRRLIPRCWSSERQRWKGREMVIVDFVDGNEMLYTLSHFFHSDRHFWR